MQRHASFPGARASSPASSTASEQENAQRQWSFPPARASRPGLEACLEAGASRAWEQANSAPSWAFSLRPGLEGGLEARGPRVAASIHCAAHNRFSSRPRLQRGLEAGGRRGLSARRGLECGLQAPGARPRQPELAGRPGRCPRPVPYRAASRLPGRKRRNAKRTSGTAARRGDSANAPAAQPPARVPSAQRAHFVQYRCRKRPDKNR